MEDTGSNLKAPIQVCRKDKSSVLKHSKINSNIEILFGTQVNEDSVYRIYQCRKCKQSFSRGHGVLLFSGFFCDEHNPKRF